MTGHAPALADSNLIDSRLAWLRLAISLLMGTIGCVGMWSVVVVLPAVQADFGTARATATLPFTLTMIGFAFGNVVMGRLADRYGIVVPVVGSTLALGFGYCLAAFAPELSVFAFAHLLIGLGSSVYFGPLMADISHWFKQRRGVAVTVAATGNYLAGAVWPPIIQYFIATAGWRPTHVGLGLFCLVTILPLGFLLRRPAPAHSIDAGVPASRDMQAVLGLSPRMLLVLLSVAGLACCVAMSMPQVHIVAYCGDLGYGPARGAEMLSLMLGLGIISRVGSGFLADRIGGLSTLLLGAVLQAATLFLYLWFDGLVSLYVVSALFGLVQGGIVPSYAIIVRDFFPPQGAGLRVGIVILSTVVGMALGGYLSGLIFDLTGSYTAAFANGFAWNLVTIAIALWLWLRSKRAWQAA